MSPPSTCGFSGTGLIRYAAIIGVMRRATSSEIEHRNGNRHAELLEVLPGDAAHERHRREDRDDRQRDRDDGEADLVGGFERGAIRRFAHVHMAHDILDLDDRVVDENAGRKRDAEQADEVQRKPERAHRPERRDGGERQRNRRDQRRAHVAQEQTSTTSTASTAPSISASMAAT